jgi:MFS family permease
MHGLVMRDEEKNTPVQDVPSVGSVEDEEVALSLVAEPPNGGLRAWLQVLCAWFLFFNSWLVCPEFPRHVPRSDRNRGIVNSFGVFQAYYTNELLPNSSSSSISWIGSIQGFLLLFVGGLSGPVFDAGYFHTLITTGSFLVVFGMMMTSVGTEYYQILLSQGICVGLGCGCLFVPSVAIVSTYFTTHRAIALGIATTGSSLAGIIYPIVFNSLQSKVGFPWATRAVGFIAFATLSVAVGVMRARVLPASKRALWDKSALKEPPFILFTTGMCLSCVGIFIPFFYVPSYSLYAAPETITPAFATYLLAILNGASTLGRILPNYIADFIGPLTTILPCALVSAILAFSWIGITTKESIIAFCALYGFFSGSFVSLPPTVIVSMTPNLNVVGTRLGMMFTVSACGLLIGSPLAGAILGPNKTNYVGLQIFCGACVAGCALFMGVTRGIKSGWKLTTKA